MIAAGAHPIRRSREERLAMVGLLLERGADVGARDGMGRTPLHCVAGDTAVAVAQLLLEAGADVNAVDDSGETLLCTTARWGWGDDRYRRPRTRRQDTAVELIEFLLTAGADSALGGRYGTPVELARGFRCPAVVKALQSPPAPAG
jgi:hypothetical protein